MDISFLLKMAADAEPERVGLTCDGRHWTYRALWNAATGAAIQLKASGAGHLALLDTGSEAAPIALFGSALAGIPYVPLNYRLPDADLGALINRIAPAVIVGDVARLKTLAGDPANQILSREVFVSCAEAAAQSEMEPGEGDAIAVQLFTSGTTAAPKAAILRHGNLFSYILGTVEFGAAGSEEAALVSVPPYHVAGIAALLSSVYAMRRIILLPSFDPKAWIKLCEEEHATNAFVVPTMLSRIIESLDDGDAKTGHARIERDRLWRRPNACRIDNPGPKIVSRRRASPMHTGLTETSSTIALLGPEEHRTALSAHDPKTARAAWVCRQAASDGGNSKSGTRVAGCCLPCNPGKYSVRGEQVSGEYRERSALTADGWFSHARRRLSRRGRITCFSRDEPTM